MAPWDISFVSPADEKEAAAQSAAASFRNSSIFYAPRRRLKMPAYP